jgi:hypothetical protein
MQSFIRHSFRKSRSLLLIGLAGVLMGCDDSTGPSDPPVGNYTAVIFTTTPTGGSTRNELQAGSSLTLNLRPDGTTSGHLHIAANGQAPAFDADMAGSWTMTGNVIDITQAADTFVRNMAFTIQQLSSDTWVLVGDEVFNGVRVNLTLAPEA